MAVPEVFNVPRWRVRAIAAQYGLPILPKAAARSGRLLGKGLARNTYQVRGVRELVVKELGMRAASGDTPDQNATELVNWVMCPEDARRFLCPLVAVREDGALVMRRATVCPSGLSYFSNTAQLWERRARKLSSEICLECNRADVVPDARTFLQRLPFDLHRNNVGMIWGEGRATVVDYGYFSASDAAEELLTSISGPRCPTADLI